MPRIIRQTLLSVRELLVAGGPFVLLAVMIVVLARVLRQRRALLVPVPLTEAERERARKLLGESGEPPW